MITSWGEEVTWSQATDVKFRDLEGWEVDAYVASGEPMDKAGSYGIQGAAGAFVESLSGCYYNVVGMPLSRVYVEVARLAAERNMKKH